MIAYDRAGRLQETPGRTRAPFPLIRAYQAGDYVVLHGLCSQDAGKQLTGDPWEVGKAYETMGPAFTVEGSTIHAAMGLVIHWPGRAVGWAILSPACRRDRRLGVWMREEIRKRLPELFGKYGLRRIEADAHASGYGIEWLTGNQRSTVRRRPDRARGLGFAVESLMPLYGADGADFFKFVRFADA